MIEAYFDGACEPVNPGGHATWGIVIKQDGKVLVERSGYVGHGPEMSNNVAEYAGLVALLRELDQFCGEATIYGDSQLVINQMSGKWSTAKASGLYVPYMKEAKLLVVDTMKKIRFEWIPRNQNEDCDKLSRAACQPE